MENLDEIRKSLKPFNGLNYESNSKLGLNVREWEDLTEAANSSSSVAENSDERLRVVCYNILCPSTFKRCKFLYDHLIDLMHLAAWERRFTYLVEELKSFDGDLICLQEVHMDYYVNFITKLSAQYEGIFRKKNFTYTYDGCMIFYRKDKFEKLYYEEVEFYVRNYKYLDYPHIAQILALKSKQSGAIFILANTHLIFKQDKGDIRLGQTAWLLATVHKIIREKHYPLDTPVIFCGDCNSEPNSGFYRFMIDGRLNTNDYSSTQISNLDISDKKRVELKIILPNQLNISRHSIYRKFNRAASPVDRAVITHPFNFKSVYDQRNNDNAKSGISTYHLRSGHPDFIFYSTGSIDDGNEQDNSDDDIQVVFDSNEQSIQLVPIRRFSLPSLETLMKLEKWPNEWVPSDHIPLAADFELRKKLGSSVESRKNSKSGKSRRNGSAASSIQAKF